MYLNIFSNRSYRDITQYPVFPWILQEYDLNKESILNLKYRDFSLPLGMMEITEKGKKRKESCLQSYKIMYNDLKLEPPVVSSFFSNLNIFGKKQEKLNLDEIEFDQIPYMFGSHFSNPAYTSHYLIRLFPFTLTAIEIQGKSFDAPDKLFININKSFNSAISEKSDLREIIPEFFVLPELFINLNNLNLGKLQKNTNEESTFTILKKKRNLKEDDPVFVDEVLLPCKCDPYKFVFEYRKLLEKAKDINKWVNLIFGKDAEHEKAELKNNVYSGYCYDDIIIKKIKNNQINEEDLISVYRLFELGFNPIPILDTDCEKTGNFADYENFENKKNSLFSCREKCIKDEKQNDEKQNDDFKESIIIKLYNGECHSKEFKIGKSKIFVCKSGSLFVFFENNPDKPFKIFHDHSNEIIDITGNELLNLFVDISKDGFINIYTYPECELIRSIYIKIKYDKFEKIYLSSSPLPSIIVETEIELISYSINGQFLNKLNDKKNIKVTELKKEGFIDYLQLSNMTKLNLPYFN